MNFATFEFWLWLALGLLVVVPLRWTVNRQGATWLSLFDRTALVVLSLFLLWRESHVTLFVFASVAAITLIGLRVLLSLPEASRKPALAVLVILQLTPLAYYKYAGFFVIDILGGDGSSWANLIIPAGVSFYTFQMIAFVVDTLRQPHERVAFVNFLGFASFFPQIVAGPIERRSKLLPQIVRFRFRFRWANLDIGLRWIILGAFMKLVLADNFAELSGPLYRDTANPFIIWFGNVLFAFRIYFDFAGYSLMAYGIARGLGIRLTLNFTSPYCTTNIAVFWRHWHRTLSFWFRDYVYIPLGGSRTKFWALALLTVFALSGVWHGAGWNFLLWGTAHGVLLVLFRLCPPLPLPRIISWILLMIAVCFTWLFFYETDTARLLTKTFALANPLNYTPANFLELRHVYWLPSAYVHLAAVMSLAMLVWFLEWLSLRWRKRPYRLLLSLPATLLMVVGIILFAPGSQNVFIYFNF